MRSLSTYFRKVTEWCSSVPRSRHWPSVREQHLKLNPYCAACGSRTNLEVHHKKPYHLFPELELDPTNLMTLCEDFFTEHHLNLGHKLPGQRASWKIYNPNVEADAASMRKHA